MKQYTAEHPTILTNTGNYFNFQDPGNSHISIQDIAHSLSNLCRFNGHVNKFYSVAQHSILVARMVPKEYRWQALMHDAVEAYTGDMASPLKRLIPQYVAIEQFIQGFIFDRYDIPQDLHGSVKHADLRALATEDRDLMPYHDDEWPCLRGVKPHIETIKAMEPWMAYESFMHHVEKYRPTR